MPRVTTRPSRLSRRAEVALVLCFVLAGVGMRAYRLGAPYLWVDEAESALNALTIVADGVPGDRYLGLPLFENILVRPWEGHEEYEFRDLSYSDRGLAVYHSWIPLYAIAGAFRLAGVTPDQARAGTPVTDARPDTIAHWTAVPRWPSIAFSALFIWAAWRLGRSVGGVPAGLAIVAAAATANYLVYAGRQARYYSASLAFVTLSGWAIWRAWRRGRWGDHALAGVSIGVLFHVHSVSAVTMACLYVCSIPLGWRQPTLWLRMVAAGTPAAILILPWAVWSGLLDQTQHQPLARSYFSVGMVIGSVPNSTPLLIAVCVGGLLWWAAARRPQLLPSSWRAPMQEHAAAVYFAACWLALAFMVFVLLVPAASFFTFRLHLFAVVPALLLATLVVTAGCSVLRPGGTFLPLAVVLSLLVASGQFPPAVPEVIDEPMADLFAEIRGWRLDDGRIYASPNEHLVHTYYTSRPVQSVMAVRRSWLDALPGDLVILESATYLAPPIVQVQALGARLGIGLTDDAARGLAGRAARRATALALQRDGVGVHDIPEIEPEGLEEPLVELSHAYTQTSLRRTMRGTPMADLVSTSARDFWHAYFFRFAHPETRTGEALNYGRCRANADVSVHETGIAVLDCRRRRDSPLLTSRRQPQGDAP